VQLDGCSPPRQASYEPKGGVTELNSAAGIVKTPPDGKAIRGTTMVGGHRYFTQSSPNKGFGKLAQSLKKGGELNKTIEEEGK